MHHLTEEQFLNAVLESQLDSKIESHLQFCTACRIEVMQFRSATADYKEASTLWAATVPLVFERPLVHVAHGGAWGRRALVFAFSCFVLLAPLIIPLTNWIRGSHQPSIAHQDSPAQIAADNQVLKAMDEDLRFGADVVSIPATEFNLQGKQKAPAGSERD